MIASEPLHHFVDDYLSSCTKRAPRGHLRRRSPPRRPARELRAGRCRTRGAVAGRSGEAVGGHQHRLADGRRAGGEALIAGHIRGGCTNSRRSAPGSATRRCTGVAGGELGRTGPVRLCAGGGAGARVLSKLRQTPALHPVGERQRQGPARIFVKSGLETFAARCGSSSLTCRVPFADVGDLGLLGDLADAQTEAIDALKSTWPPRIGRCAQGAGVLRLGSDVSPPSSASRKASKSRSIACSRSGCANSTGAGGIPRRGGRVEPGDPLEVWRRVKDRHAPADGIVMPPANNWRGWPRHLAPRPGDAALGEAVTVAPTPDFFRWSSQHVDAGPSRRERRALTTTSPTPTRRGCLIAGRITCAT